MTYTINSFEERGVAIPFTGATLAHAKHTNKIRHEHRQYPDGTDTIVAWASPFEFYTGSLASTTALATE